MKALAKVTVTVSAAILAGSFVVAIPQVHPANTATNGNATVNFKKYTITSLFSIARWADSRKSFVVLTLNKGATKAAVIKPITRP